MTRATVAIIGGLIAAALILTAENFWLEAFSIAGIAAAARWGVGR